MRPAPELTATGAILGQADSGSGDGEERGPGGKPGGPDQTAFSQPAAVSLRRAAA